MKDDAEMLAGSMSFPFFSVWCCVRFARHSADRLEDDYMGELWIKLPMPAILPVGSWVDLPTPSFWRPISGITSGKISSWSLVGNAIVCEIDDPSHIGSEEVAELLAIGYVDASGEYPDEVVAAFGGLLR